MAFGDRLKHAWNAFTNDQEKEFIPAPFAPSAGYGNRPDRPRSRVASERSLISSIYTRLAVDASAIDVRHVKLDDNNRYAEDVVSGLNNCLMIEANQDQAATAFRQDAFSNLLEKGVIALVPVDTSVDPGVTAGFDIKTMRVGEITQWYPYHVRVSLYNEAKGVRQELMLPKSTVAVVENPFYSIMNEPNSTLQRLIRKLSLLDIVDEQSSSGKLDLIIQLPYVIKSEARRQQADQRRRDIELQLKGSQYGIAYTDGTEKITQLNRPVENNLLAQVEMLTAQLYAQLGLTTAIMDQTAVDAVMLNYYSRVIEPLLDALVEGMIRVFLTKTARTQKQSIMYFRDPFKLVPITTIADIADKFSRNEIMSANEIRGVMGLKPSTDPKADQLVNSNMPQPGDPAAAPPPNAAAVAPPTDDGSTDDAMNSAFASLDGMLNDLNSSLGVDSSAPN